LDDPQPLGLILGPQWVSVAQPQQSGTYGVGVRYDFDNFRISSSALINVYCYGILEGTFGPVTLTNGDQFPPDNDFWKVAEVDMNSGGCEIFPYLNGGEPVIVLGRDAEAAR
jgi:hypothetical protein